MHYLQDYTGIGSELWHIFNPNFIRTFRMSYRWSDLEELAHEAQNDPVSLHEPAFAAITEIHGPLHLGDIRGVESGLLSVDRLALSTRRS